MIEIFMILCPRLLGNCAHFHKGGWWYNACGQTNLNGVWYSGGVYRSKFQDGIFWAEYGGGFYSLKSVRLMIRPIDWNIGLWFPSNAPQFPPYLYLPTNKDSKAEPGAPAIVQQCHVKYKGGRDGGMRLWPDNNDSSSLSSDLLPSWLWDEDCYCPSVVIALLHLSVWKVVVHQAPWNH